MRVLVDIKTFCDSLAHPGDHAVIDLTDHHRERVRTFRRVLNEVGADFLEVFDYTPEFHFVDPESRADAVQLTVSEDGEFWWTGYLKHTDIAWETQRIPSGLLDRPDDGVHDFRENKEDIEPPEEDGEDAI